MANIKDSLDTAMQIEGAAGVALVDLKSGMALGLAGDSPNLDVEAAANADILKAKFKVLTTLGRKDSVEDILITLGTRYHLLRVVGGAQGLMLYLNLHRAQSNLALARHKLTQIESELVV
jgi:hypothetical protein